jgi:hypothetical protein
VLELPVLEPVVDMLAVIEAVVVPLPPAPEPTN